MTTSNLRNIAIVAHVDHGKTTLVDQLLRQSGTLEARVDHGERVMDSNDIEKERGITILAKNTAITWNGFKINIVDTPGHADFGGEVERVLSMVDSVLILVDAVDGPMPQTTFVTKKALAHGLKPIVVVNKIDRPSARPDWVVDQTFDLFVSLGASDEQLDFPIVFASAMKGYATLDHAEQTDNMHILFDTIVNHVPSPDVDAAAPFQMQVSSLSYSKYTGLIAIGRIRRGKISTNSNVVVAAADGSTRKGRVLQIFGFHGLEQVEKTEESAGSIVQITGIADLKISDTLCDPDFVESVAPLVVDEPTITMTFQVNDSPFAGKEGKFVTSRNLKERLERELIHNVALRVETTENSDKFKVSGRGELHLAILIENMRREGYELAISQPEVILKEIDGELCEPWELLTVDVEEQHQGAVIEKLGQRKGKLKNMVSDIAGRIRLDYEIPTRGLIGFRSEFLSLTTGTGLLHHVFDRYGPKIQDAVGRRNNGVLVSMVQGSAVAYAIFNLQERGKMFIDHGTEVYEGMVIGIHSRENDLVVNPLKGKQLTNIRAAGADEAIILVPKINTTLEYALEFINNDELVEVTPKSIRIRKKHLKEVDRKRASKV
jgi:GTP-binding protein